MSRHTDREYAQQLQRLRERISEMAALVERMIGEATEAFLQRDAERARATILLDRQVNALEVETDELCLRVLARWQPMASDLRFLTFSLKTVTDLERIGDLAVNICERAVDLSEMPAFELPEELAAMSGRVRSMVRDAVRACMERDAELAREVIARDDLVDEAYTHVFRDVLERMRADASVVARGIHVQSVAKWLERIADHATNVAEQVVFLVEGRDVRHEGRRGPASEEAAAADAAPS